MAYLKVVRRIKQNKDLAFHYSNYNWFILGSFISRTGEWFDRVAINWFIFSVTGSPLNIAMVEFCRLFPIIIFSIFGGLAADRWERHKVLVVIQFGAMISTLVLAFLMYKGLESLFFFYLVIFIRGIFLAFEIPTRNALVSNLVPKIALASAISFFSATLNLSRVIGPALAGILLSFWSAPILILLNGISFMAVIGTLLLTQPSKSKSNENKTNQDLKMKEGLKEVIKYLKLNPIVLGVFVLGVVPMIFGYPYSTLMPVFAKELLNVGPEGFGMLLSATALGAFLMSVLLGWGKYPFAKGWFLFTCICGFGAGIILFAFTNFYPLSLLVMFIIGVASQGYRIVERVIIQEIIPDHLRGRILSIVTMDSGLIPLGDLTIGFLGEKFGAVPALILMGSVCITTAVIVISLNRSILSLK